MVEQLYSQIWWNIPSQEYHQTWRLQRQFQVQTKLQQRSGLQFLRLKIKKELSFSKKTNFQIMILIRFFKILFQFNVAGSSLDFKLIEDVEVIQEE